MISPTARLKPSAAVHAEFYERRADAKRYAEDPSTPWARLTVPFRCYQHPVQNISILTSDGERMPKTLIATPDMRRIIARDDWDLPVDLLQPDQHAQKVWLMRTELTPVSWILAIPGMGKTTLQAQFQHLAIYDEDYGHWRREHGARKADLTPEEYRNQLRRFMDHCGEVALANAQKAGGSIVILVNEIDLLPYILALGHEAMVVIPKSSFASRWKQGICDRVGKLETCGVQHDHEFATRAMEQGDRWLLDWKAAAQASGLVPLELGRWMNQEDLRWCRRGRLSNPVLYAQLCDGRPWPTWTGLGGRK